MRRFEFSEGNSNKFWEIDLQGTSFTVTWGKIGTAGQTQTKDFPTDAKAQAEHDKLIKEKTNKGYVETGAAASTATAPAAAPRAAAPKPKPAASSPASTPPSSPPPSAAPPVISAAPPAPPTSLSFSTNDVAWDDEARKEVHPTRVFNPFPERLELAKAHATLQKCASKGKEVLKKYIAGADEDLKGALEAAKERMKLLNGTPSDVTAEALLYKIFAYHQDAQPEALEALVDPWFAVSPTFAVECLATAEKIHLNGDWDKPKEFSYTKGTHTYEYNIFSAAFFSPAIRLRGLLASLSETAWQETWKAVENSDFLPDLLAYLFPDSGLANRLKGATAAMMMSLTDSKVLAANAMGQNGYSLNFRTRARWRNESAPWEIAYTWLANTGVDAWPALVELLKAEHGGGEWPKAAADALSRIPKEEALKALFARLDDKNVVAGALAAATRYPGPALGLLSAQVASRTKNAGSAQIMLTQLVRQDIARASELVAGLSEPQKKVVLATIDKLGPSEEATSEELPKVFVSPPWLQKKKAVTAKVVEGLSMLPYASTVVWPEGQRSAWINDEERREPDPADQKRVKEVLKSLDFDMDIAPLAMKEDPSALAAWKKEKEKEHRWKWEGYLLNLPKRLALLFWNELPPTTFYGDSEKSFAAIYELEALEGLLSRVGRNAEKLELLLGFDHPDIGVMAAETLAFRKKGKPMADKWLKLHPEAAIIGLLPVAVGRAGKARDAAENGLRVVAGHGKKELVLEVAGRYQNPAVVEAVEGVLATDPLDQVPSKIPKMPDFWTAASFARPRLKNNNRVLPLASVEALGSMLAFSQLEAPYGGIAVVKELCSTESLGDFAWDLFHAWNFAGAPSKEGWAFRQLGMIGSDDCARKLSPLIRQWPGESQHQRAVTGLDVLAGIGTDVALMHLNGIAQKVKFKGLQEAAREKIQLIAENRGLSPEELADRLVPDLGLDERGTMLLDFGPRQFSVGFDEALRPNVKDATGKVLPDLPKPNKNDEAEKAAAATDAWKTLKKDVKTLASQQLIRLEVAMCSRRRWTEEVFRLFLANHPLVGHLVRRLVWGAYSEEGNLLYCFRVAEDGSFADGEDQSWELPEGLKIGVVHALDMSVADAARFGQIFADYEILQPFRQLGREVYSLTDEEKAANTLSRFNKLKVPTGKVLGLDGRGWRRGPPQDAGLIWWFVRPLPLAGYEIHMHLDPGIAVGMVNEFPEQTIDGISIVKIGAYSWRSGEGEKTFSTLDSVTASELIRELEGLRS